MLRICFECKTRMGCYSGKIKIECGGHLCTGICPEEESEISHGICQPCYNKKYGGADLDE